MSRDTNSALVDVVIVTWNCESVVSECLASLDRITDVELSTIVVDNASTDRTIERIKGFTSVNKTVALAENVGFARASNMGARMGTAPFVLMLNPDTVVAERAISQLVQSLQADKRRWAVGPKILLPTGHIQRECNRKLPSLWGITAEGLYLHMLFRRAEFFHGVDTNLARFDSPGAAECILGACMLFRRDTWNTLDGFDESVFMYLEDIDICARIREGGGMVWYESEAVITHFAGHSSRQSTRNLDLLVGEVRSSYFNRHGGSGSARLAALIVALSSLIRAVLSPVVELRRGSNGYWVRVWGQMRTSCGLLIWSIGYLLSGPPGELDEHK